MDHKSFFEMQMVYAEWGKVGIAMCCVILAAFLLILMRRLVKAIEKIARFFQ